MKKLILLLILFKSTFLFSFNSGINYQAVLRDSEGNILSNQNVTIEVALTVSDGSEVYIEEHTTQTSTQYHTSKLPTSR